VTGFAAIMELYRAIAGGMADSKHFWTTTVLDDGTLECRWVQAARDRWPAADQRWHRARDGQHRRADHEPAQPNGVAEQPVLTRASAATGLSEELLTGGRLSKQSAVTRSSSAGDLSKIARTVVHGRHRVPRSLGHIIKSTPCVSGAPVRRIASI
jgi:hypothetical protein